MTNKTITKTLTRAEARRKVAELQGWEPPQSSGPHETRPGVWVGGVIIDTPIVYPDCFEPGAALALLWELPERYISQSPSQHNLSMRLLWMPTGEKKFGIEKGSWLTKTLDQFAVACVCAFLTARTGSRVEIKD